MKNPLQEIHYSLHLGLKGSFNYSSSKTQFIQEHARFLSPAHLHVTAPEFSPDSFGGDEYVMRICFFRCATRSLGGRDLRHVLLDLRYSRLELCVGKMLVGLLREGGDQRLHFFDGVIEVGRLRARGIARRAEVGELRLVSGGVDPKDLMDELLSKIEDEDAIKFTGKADRETVMMMLNDFEWSIMQATYAAEVSGSGVAPRDRVRAKVWPTAEAALALGMLGHGTRACWWFAESQLSAFQALPQAAQQALHGSHFLNGYGGGTDASPSFSTFVVNWPNRRPKQRHATCRVEAAGRLLFYRERHLWHHARRWILRVRRCCSYRASGLPGRADRPVARRLWDVGVGGQGAAHV